MAFFAEIRFEGSYCIICCKYEHLNKVTALICENYQKTWWLTASRSSPSLSKLVTADDKLWGFHWGYSCQFIRLLTPGHISSFGVPNNLHTRVSKRMKRNPIDKARPKPTIIFQESSCQTWKYAGAVVVQSLQGRVVALWPVQLELRQNTNTNIEQY